MNKLRKHGLEKEIQFWTLLWVITYWM